MTLFLRFATLLSLHEMCQIFAKFGNVIALKCVKVENSFLKARSVTLCFLGQSSPELVLLEEKQPTNEQNELTLKSESLLLEFGFVRRNQMSCERKLSVFACYYR